MALKWQDYIEERKDVMLGEPVFKGTRLTVEHILRELGTGMSPDELFDNYPNLKPQHVQAALHYAGKRTSPIERGRRSSGDEDATGAAEFGAPDNESV